MVGCQRREACVGGNLEESDSFVVSLAIRAGLGDEDKRRNTSLEGLGPASTL